jgi:hypothetical protein
MRGRSLASSYYKGNTRLALAFPIEATFDTFWTELKSFLSVRKLIRNWTVQKGYYGENFEAIYDFGKVVVFPISASRQEVPRADFKLIFDNWRKYIDGKIDRKELCEYSRFTKYTISIIHEFLTNENQT